MMNKLKKIIFLSLTIAGLTLVSGHLVEVKAQCGGDPFCKPASQTPKNPTAKSTTVVNKDGSVSTKPVKAPPQPVVPVGVPPIQDRINYYKELRRIAAERGDETLPKVTSVLTLDEMSISGIFRTPRGYAAIVQATPISLSYTIYPGEKFFNGQLVAIEENRLVFRKVIKMSNGKFISSEENKSLRLYSEQEQIQGTAPVDAAKNEAKPAETAQAGGQPTDPTKPVQPVSIISPLDEMNRQPVETPKSAKDKSTNKKGKTSSTKKPVKVAANKK